MAPGSRTGPGEPAQDVDPAGGRRADRADGDREGQQTRAGAHPEVAAEIEVTLPLDDADVGEAQHHEARRQRVDDRLDPRLRVEFRRRSGDCKQHQRKRAKDEKAPHGFSSSAISRYPSLRVSQDK